MTTDSTLMSPPVCVGGRARKLIDARFVRALSGREREKLEGHLIACAACDERYRRLQLAERVAAHGPEDAFDLPSPSEIERIAADLGFAAATPKRSFEWRWLLMAAAATSIAIGAAVLVPEAQTPEAPMLVPRGDSQDELTFSVYTIGADRNIAPLEDGATISKAAHVKIRASFRDGAKRLGNISVIVETKDGREEIRLDGPAEAFQTASIPGAVSLSRFPAGPATITVRADDRQGTARFEVVLTEPAP